MKSALPACVCLSWPPSIKWRHRRCQRLEGPHQVSPHLLLSMVVKWLAHWAHVLIQHGLPIALSSAIPSITVPSQMAVEQCHRYPVSEGHQFRLAALQVCCISLLLSVHGRSSPVIENKSRETDVNSWSPMLTLRLISNRECATINMRANSGRVSLSSTTWSATDFLALFNVFSWILCILAQLLTSFGSRTVHWHSLKCP